MSDLPSELPKMTFTNDCRCLHIGHQPDCPIHGTPLYGYPEAAPSVSSSAANNSPETLSTEPAVKTKSQAGSSSAEPAPPTFGLTGDPRLDMTDQEFNEASEKSFAAPVQEEAIDEKMIQQASALVGGDLHVVLPDTIREAFDRCRNWICLPARYEGAPYGLFDAKADLWLVVTYATALRKAFAGSISERETLTAALQEIDAIRNSIVGTQQVNWSAHIYPLVAALGKAGFVGLGYEKASAEAKTLIQQRDEAEAAVARLTTDKAAVEFNRNIRTVELANAVANHLGVNPADEIPFEELTRRLWELPPVDGFGSHKADLAELRLLQTWREQAIQDIEALPRYAGVHDDSVPVEVPRGDMLQRSAVLSIVRGST